jgi:hypothetical protein
MTYPAPENVSGLMFNVANCDGKMMCPCCGMTDQFSTINYDSRGGIIGSDICGACLWEPGFDDDPMASADAAPTIIESLLVYRAKWLSMARYRSRPTGCLECKPETSVSFLTRALPGWPKND